MSTIMKSTCIVGVILYLANDVSAFGGDARRGSSYDASMSQLMKSRSRTKNGITMLVDPENPKQKIITPNDIASLFGGGSKSSGSKSKTPSDYDDDDDDFEYDMYDDEATPSGDKQPDKEDAKAEASATTTTAPTMKAAVIEEEETITAPKVPEEESATMRELFALQEMALKPVQQEVALTGDGGDGMFMTSDVTESSPAEDESSVESELPYMNLDRVLDKSTRRKVQDSISVTDTVRASSVSTSPRVVRYDPSETVRGDPMKYGAYRRWKLAEGLENTDSRGRPRKTSGRGAAKGSSPGSGYRPGDYKIDGQGGVGGKAVGSDNKSNSKNKKKNKGGSTTDAFYKAIREMGSRPVSGDSVSGTGVAEPKGNKNPIIPKKAPTKKNRKRVITPDDINSLFSDKKQAAADEDEDDDDEDDDGDDGENGRRDVSAYAEDDDEEEEDEEEEEESKSVQVAKRNEGMREFNPMITPNDEIPQWLVDANKEAEKKRKQVRGRKKKSLTDDWRFWAACIAGVGFLSAFWSIYQQTGGFGSDMGGDRQELII